MIIKAKILKYNFTNCWKQSVTQIFTNQSIKQRLQHFKNYNTQQQGRQSQIQIQEIKIVNPSYLKIETAKNLSNYIKKNQIRPNIRILHSLCHIQYNAFMSYVDTYFKMQKFINQQTKRQQFKNQIKKIGIDEGQHFILLSDRLQQLNCKYGDIPVINQLSVAIQSTQGDIFARIGIISLLHQGKGMKAVKKLMIQLQRENDKLSLDILKHIESQEVFHFKNGLKWFKYLCQQQQISLQEAIEKVNSKSYQKLSIPQIRDQ